jgi:alkylated DNA repair protein alkB family protein 1
LIPRYFDGAQQEALLTASLAEYTRPPNPLSLDTHYALPPNMFELYASAPDTPVLPRHLELDETERAARAEEAQRTAGTRPLIETAPAFTMGFDEVKRRNATWTGDAMSLKAGTKSVEALMKEMRWGNLGWVYQVSFMGRLDS